jgi:hypothetical protein
MAERRQCLRTYIIHGPVVYGTKNEIRYAILNCASFGFVPPLQAVLDTWILVVHQRPEMLRWFGVHQRHDQPKLTRCLLQVAQVPAPRVDRNVCPRLWSLRAAIHPSLFAIVLHPRFAFSSRRCCRITYNHRTFFTRVHMVGSLSQPPLVPVSGSSSSTPPRT